MRTSSSLIVLHGAVQFSQYHLLKRLSSLVVCSRFLYHRVLTLQIWIHFWVLYSVMLIYVSLPVPVPYCFDYSNFIVQWEIRKHGTSALFSLKIISVIQGLLSFHINFRIICSLSVENTVSILMGNALYLQISLGSMVILTTLTLSTVYLFVCQCHLQFLSRVSYGFLTTGLFPLQLDLFLGVLGILFFLMQL